MASFISTFFYEPLNKVDSNSNEYDGIDKPQNNNNRNIKSNWRDYPALQASPLTGTSPPAQTVLVKTGGNALQAVDRQALQQENTVAVTVPWLGKAGQTLLVRVPSSNATTTGSRLVRTRIPDNIPPGSVFLVKLPPPSITTSMEATEAYTGIPVDMNSTTTATHHSTRIVGSEEVPMAKSFIPDDLCLHEEEEEQVELTSSNTETATNKNGRLTEEGNFIV